MWFTEPKKHIKRLMKTKTKSYIFPLIINLLVNINCAYPQVFQMDSIFSDSDTKDLCIKDFSAKLYNNSVYLKIIINGLETTSVIEIERSVDGTVFEKIGSFLHHGTTVNLDIMKCYTDNCPLAMKTYYRVVRKDSEGNKYTSEIVSVLPENNEEIQPTVVLSEKN
jgi:hypothetical protein